MEPVPRLVHSREELRRLTNAAQGVMHVSFVGLASLLEADEALFDADTMENERGWHLLNRVDLQLVSDFSRRLQLRRQQVQKILNAIIYVEPAPSTEEEIGRLVEARLAMARARIDANAARRSTTTKDAGRRSRTLPVIVDHSMMPRFVVPGSTSTRDHALVTAPSSSRAQTIVADPSSSPVPSLPGGSSSGTGALAADPSSRVQVQAAFSIPSSTDARATPPLRPVPDHGSSSRGPGTQPRGVTNNVPNSSAPGNLQPDAPRGNDLLQAPQAHPRRAPTLKEARAVHAAARLLAKRADRADGFREVIDRLLRKMDSKLNGPVVVSDLCAELRDMEEMAPARLAHYAACRAVLR